MDKKLLIFSAIITVLYAVFTLNTVLHHEVWADEAQVWQLCSCLSAKNLLIHLQNEGHPALFYFLVFPFAKIFSDIIYMKLICWIFMCLSVFLLLYFSPFKWYSKIAIVLSAGFIYFFPVLARNYSIIPFLIFMAAILYSKQKEHPILYAFILVLIANTHIIMFAFAFFLALLFMYENRKDISRKIYILSSALIIFGLLCVILLLCHTTGNNIFLKIHTDYILIAIYRIISLFFINGYSYDIWIEKSLNNTFVDLFCILLSVILYILLLVNLFKNSKKYFFIAFLSIGFQFAIYVLAYNSFVYVNRIFCAHIILIFCFWLLSKDEKFREKTGFWTKKSLNVLLAMFFILTFNNGLNYTIKDLKLPYSGAKETAEFIKNNIPAKNALILIDNEPYMVSLVYYLRNSHELFSVFRRENLKFVRWDYIAASNFADLGWSQFASYMQDKYPDYNIYVINVKSDKKHVIEETQKDYFDMIFISSDSVEIFEGYRIFKLKNKI